MIENFDYPKLIIPNSLDLFQIGEVRVNIPKCSMLFESWKGIPIKETFGGKALVNIDGRPMFAELAIMSLFIKSGWKSCWIETYGKSNQGPIFLTNWKDEKFKNQTNAPIIEEYINERLKKIAEYNQSSYSGCWDVIGWKGDRIIFAESKRFGRDNIRESQINWLSAGLRSGLSPENFLLVEWDFKK